MSKEDLKQPSPEWEPASKIAPRMSSSSSTLYSLVRRGADIPHVRLGGKILFCWESVNAWLHQLEKEKRKRDFED
jgi:excisionase family DNA binding protein